MSNIVYTTEEGLKKMKDELHQLKSKDRTFISGQIAEARDKGDLSENAEYDAAKEAQGLLELKISKLEKTIMNTRIIDESKMDSDKVLILSKVKLLNKVTNTEITWTLVPEKEADLKQGKISVDSPIGRGLLGKKKDDEAEIAVPSGQIMHFRILEVSR